MVDYFPNSIRSISARGIVSILPSLSTILMDPEAELALDPDAVEPPKKSSGVPPFANCLKRSPGSALSAAKS